MTWKDEFPKENRYYETENGILYNVDSLEILKQFPKNSIDLVLTDPPYGVGSNELNGIMYKDNFYDVDKYADLFYKILKNDTRLFVFTAQKTFIEVLTKFSRYFDLHQTLIYFRPNLAGGTKKKTFDFTSVYEQILNLHKGKPSKLNIIKGFNNFDVLKYASPQSNYKDKRYHIHQKPLKLIEHLISVSTNENDLVLDPFMGSGTTAVASEKLNRRWVGIELEKEYCDITIKRIEEIK